MIYLGVMLIAFLMFGAKKTENRLNSEKTQTDRRYLMVCIMLFLVSALRNPAVGYDTLTYVAHFERVSQLPISQILLIHSTEPGFFLFCKFISVLLPDAQWMLAAVAIVYAIAITSFIKKYSLSTTISIVALIAFQFFAFSMTGLRQTLAIALILLATRFAIARKPIKFVLLVFTAYLFHNSAILATPIYLMFSKSKCVGGFNTNRLRALFLCVLPVIYVFRREIADIVLLFIYTEYEILEVESSAWTTLILYLSIWGLYVATRSVCDGFEKMLMAGIVVQLFVPLEPAIFRVAMYYQISVLVIVPRVIICFKEGISRTVAYVACLGILLLMYLGFTYYSAGANPYAFFWQSV